MPGVEVRLFPEAERLSDPAFKVRTSSDGTFKLPDLPAGGYRIEGIPADDSFAGRVIKPLKLFLRSGENMTNCELREVSGAVTFSVHSKEDGKPVPGVNGYVRQETYSLDDKGTGTVRLSAGGEAFNFSKDGWESRTYQTNIVAGQTSRIDVVLAPGPRLKGLVQDSSGKPVAGASITVFTDGFGSSGMHWKTKSDGTFVVNWYQGWERNMNASAGILAQDFTNNLAAFVPLVRGVHQYAIRLVPALAINGLAKDWGGNVVSNASVRYDEVADHRLTGSTMTDGKGCFGLKALLPGHAYRIFVGTMHGSGSAQIPTNAPLTLELPPIVVEVPGQRLQAGTLPREDAPARPAQEGAKRIPKSVRCAGWVKSVTGEAIPAVDVETYQLVFREPLKQGKYQFGQRVTTKPNGAFDLTIPFGKTLLLAKKAGRVLSWMEFLGEADTDQINFGSLRRLSLAAQWWMKRVKRCLSCRASCCGCNPLSCDGRRHIS